MFKSYLNRLAFCAILLLPVALALFWGSRSGDIDPAPQSNTILRQETANREQSSAAAANSGPTVHDELTHEESAVEDRSCPANVDNTFINNDSHVNFDPPQYGAVRQAGLIDPLPPARLSASRTELPYPATGYVNAYSSKASEELPKLDEVVPSIVPPQSPVRTLSTGETVPGFDDPQMIVNDKFNGDRQTSVNRLEPQGDWNQTVQPTVELTSPKRFNPLRNLSAEFSATSVETQALPLTDAQQNAFSSASLKPKQPIGKNNTNHIAIVSKSKQDDSAHFKSDAPKSDTMKITADVSNVETSVVRMVESSAGGTPLSNQVRQPDMSPRVAAKAVESGGPDNRILSSIATENYSYSERKSDPTAIENAWQSHRQPDRISGTLWWTEPSRQTLREGTVALPMDLDSLLVRALEHSAQIQVFSELPLIRDTAITEASANFDWTAFMESMWNDTSDPVGSTLTTGGSSRYNDHHLTSAAGVRRRNAAGGQFEVAQEFGFQNNNSDFFVPNDQGTARLRMNYTHPLLRGGGRYYNQSLIVLARVDSKVARDELERQIEGHLLEVTRAYWGLALERGAYLQRVRLYERSREIRDKLVGRQGLDSYRSQIVRADSAVSSREAALIRAEVAVRNAEARIRALVNDPEFANENCVEIIPTDDPIDYKIDSVMEEVLLVAMQKRSEIQQAFKQIKAAGVRREMTKNELLPTLNLVMNSYLSGLRGNTNIPGAWVDQFSVGAPSYGVGLQFDVPVANRAAKARHVRRRLELRQFESQMRLTMETVNLEVGVAVRETDASFREMQAKYRAMVAASEDAQFVKQRWELLPGDHQNASLVFDDLLRTQERLTDAENEFLKAQTTYNLSLTNIKKAAGILLETERIDCLQTTDDYAPQIMFEKSSGEYLPQETFSQPASENAPPTHMDEIWDGPETGNTAPGTDQDPTSVILPTRRYDSSAPKIAPAKNP